MIHLSKKAMIISAATAGLLLIGGIFTYGGYYGRPPIVVPPGASNEHSNERAQSDSDAPDLEGIRDVPKKEGSQPGGESRSAEIGVTITQTESSGGKIIVRALVDGLKSGDCTVTFSKFGQRDVIQTVPIGLVTSYYACQGFDIPVSQFPAKGTWQVEVKASDGVKFNTTPKQSIEVN